MTRIRLLRSGDAEALAAVLVRNREFLEPWEPVRPDHYFTVDGQAEVVADSLHRHELGQLGPYVIVDDDGAAVGRINLNNIVRGPFQSASVGYWLAQEAGGRGFATAAVAEIVRIAFTEEGLHRVEAGTIPENFRSQMVLRRNGFTQFGYAPHYLNIAGTWADHLLFQKLADD